MNTLESERKCPVCGEQRAEFFLSKNGLRLVECCECSMIYASVVPSQMTSGRFYREAAAYYLSEEKLKSDFSAVRYERELKMFRKYCRAGDVLDVGCSSGAFLYQLGKRFPHSYSLYGTDVSTPSLEFAANRGIKIIEGDFPEHDFGTRRFDAITFWAVLEHLTDPKRFIEKAAGLLKMDGICFALVPNMHSIAARVLGWRYRYILSEHVNYFTRTTLTALIADHFDVVCVHYTHFNPVVIFQDWRSGGAEVSQSSRASLLQKTTALKSSPLAAPAKLFYRCAEAVFAAAHLTDNLVVVLRKKVVPESKT